MIDSKQASEPNMKSAHPLILIHMQRLDIQQILSLTCRYSGKETSTSNFSVYRNTLISGTDTQVKDVDTLIYSDTIILHIAFIVTCTVSPHIFSMFGQLVMHLLKGQCHQIRMALK